MTTSADPVTSGWPTSSEFEESDITDTEGLGKVIEESTDMEMAWQTHTLMITSDREKVRLEAHIKEQGCTMDEAVRQVQEWHLEEVQAITSTVRCRDDGRSSFKCHSTSREEDIKRSRGESPEYSTMPEKEDTAYTANINQISSSWPHLVGGIRAPGVSHHLDTALIAEPDLIADTTLTAKAPCPASHIAEISPSMLPGRDQWPKPRDWWKQHLHSCQHRKIQN